MSGNSVDGALSTPYAKRFASRKSTQMMVHRRDALHSDVCLLERALVQASTIEVCV